jgi:hypothetical protein
MSAVLWDVHNEYLQCKEEEGKVGIEHAIAIASLIEVLLYPLQQREIS